MAIYGSHFAQLDDKAFVLKGFDPEGMDLAVGYEPGRVLFMKMFVEAADLRRSLVEMAKEGRATKF